MNVFKTFYVEMVADWKTFTMNTLKLLFTLLLGVCTCMAQTLTSSFTFTASGYIGTPATATTPFQGQTFTNANIIITGIGNTANRIYDSNNYCVQNDSASVTISGVGTYQITSSALHSQATVDPIKGITGETIGLWIPAPGFCNAAFPFVFVSVQGSSLWDMTSSLGPIISSSQLLGFPVTTSGGTLQLNNPSLSAITTKFQAGFTGTPPAPTLTRSGVLSHIAAGGGWGTVISLVNTSSKAVPVTVNLHNDDSSALTLPLTTTQQGVSQTTTASSVNATLNPNATLQISMGNGITSTVAGWADVLSTGTLGGYAIFRQTPQTGSPSEGTVPLQSQYPSMITLPYDNTAGFVIGVALANLSTSLAYVTATMYDASGNHLGTQTITIAGSGHTSFVLPTTLTPTAGQLGIVQFQSTSTEGIAGIGLRFSPFGTFTSVPTM
jgi:hypothetical protein